MLFILTLKTLSISIYPENSNNTMNENLSENLNIIAIEDSSWEEKDKWENDNYGWLKLLTYIAVRVLSALRKGGEIKTQEKLAKKLKVNPEDARKIVKGRENPSLEITLKLEKALNIRLIAIFDHFEIAK